MAIDFSTIHAHHNLMSTEPPAEPTPKLKGKLKAALDDGALPAPTTPDPKTPDADLWDVGFEIKEEDKILNQENFDKLIALNEKMVEHTVKKDVMAHRDKILDEIKTIDEETYEAEKDNQTINELQRVLATIKRIKPNDDGPTSTRDVGAVDKGKPKDAPKTQYDHLKDEFVSG